MQKLIVFIIIYLYPSLGMYVFAWENLNELFCLLSSHHLDSVVFTSICKTGESYFTHLLSSVSFCTPQYTDGHMSFLPVCCQEQAAARGCSPSLLTQSRTLPPRGRREKLEIVFTEIIGTYCDRSKFYNAGI